MDLKALQEKIEKMENKYLMCMLIIVTLPIYLTFIKEIKSESLPTAIILVVASLFFNIYAIYRKKQ
tara:strand:+ start:2132 stop:2329 length:198 start_codon:yes stop_codon:yes gene_type:complete